MSKTSRVPKPITKPSRWAMLVAVENFPNGNNPVLAAVLLDAAREQWRLDIKIAIAKAYDASCIKVAEEHGSEAGKRIGSTMREHAKRENCKEVVGR